VSQFHLSRAAVNAAADAVVSLLDGGTITIYDGPQPPSANRDPAARSVRLVTLQLDRPAFKPAVAGEAVANPMMSARAVASGTPTWFRGSTADGANIWDGDVGVEGSGADLELSAVMIPAGAEVLISSLTYRQPEA
jgi:hypothetical protein